MAGNYDRYWSRSKGTTSPFRLEGLKPFKCTYPVHLTDIMDAGQSSQTNYPRYDFGTSPLQETRTKAVREYEQTIDELRKENFDLKLKLFLIEEESRKTCHKQGGYSNEKENCIQVIINLRLETEELKKSLHEREQEILEKCHEYQPALHEKEEELQNALARVEELSAKFKESQENLTKQQEMIGLMEQFPTEEDCKEISAQYDALLSTNKSLEKLVEEMTEEIEAKNQKIDEMDHEIEKINQSLREQEGTIAVLKKKNYQKEMALNACIKKYHKDVDYIPKHIRPILQSTMKAAESNSEIELLSHLDDLRKSLIQIMPDSSKLLKTCPGGTRAQDVSSVRSANLSSESSLIEGSLRPSDSSVKSSSTSSESLVEGDLGSSELAAAAHLLSESFSEESIHYFKRPEIPNSSSSQNVMDNETINKLIKDNQNLIHEIEENSKTIHNLTAACSSLDEREKELQNKLSEAFSKIKYLERELEEKSQVANNLAKEDLASQTDIVWHSLELKISDKDLQEFGTSNHVEELKEEILMLILAIEQKDQEFTDLNQTLLMLQENMNDQHKTEGLIPPDDEDFSAERNELQQRLAISCSVNNELFRHLQSLERFMEDLLQQKNLSTSSLENINETTDFFAQLSKCLDESMKLSHRLSDELSICEGSRIFELNDTTLQRTGFDVSDIKSIGRFLDSRFSQDESDILSNHTEGRVNFYSSITENQYVLGTSKLNISHKLRPFTQQIPATNSLNLNQDNAIVLKTSNNEDLILLLNEQGGPKDVLIRNNASSFNQSAEQHRRRCWDLPANDDFRNNLSLYRENSYNAGNLNPFKPAYMRYNTWMSSDSDTWSEPDRNVSMQRIGIDVQTSPITSRSPKRSRYKDRRITEDSTKNESASSYAKLHTLSKRRRSSETSKMSFVCKKCQNRSTQLDDTLREEIPDLYNENLNRQTELETTTKALKDKEELIEYLTQEKDILTNQITDLKDALSEMKSNNNMLITKNNQITQNLNEKDSCNKELQSIIADLEKNVQNSNAECEQLRTELRQTKEHLVKLDEKCSQTEKTLLSYSKDNADCHKKLSLLEQREKSILESIKELTSQKDSLLDRLEIEAKRAETATKDNSEMEEKVRTYSKDVLQLQNSNRELKDLNDSLMNSKASAEAKLELANSLNEKLKLKIKRIKENADESKSKCDSFEKEIQRYSSSKQNVLKLLMNFENSFANNLKILEKSCDTGFDLNGEDSDDLEDIYSLQDEQFKSLLKNIVLGNLELKWLAKEIGQQFQNIKAAMQNSNAALDEERNKLSYLDNKLLLKEDEIKTLNDEINGLQNFNDEINELNNKLQSSIEVQDDKMLNSLKEKENQIKVLEGKQEQLMNKLKEAQTQLQSANCDIASLQESVESYKNLLDSKHTEINKLQERIFGLQSQINVILSEKMSHNDSSQSKCKETPEKAVSPDSSTIIEVSSDSVLHSVSKSIEESNNSCSSVKLVKSHDSFSTAPNSKDNEKYLKFIKSLQLKVEAADKRVEMLEKEKSSLQENLLTHVRSGRRASNDQEENNAKAFSELKSKLETKQSFIKELKSDLYKANDSLIDKQKEIDKLHRELLKHKKLLEDNARILHRNIPGSRLSDSCLLSTETNISDLRKRKRELINTLLSLQKEFYEDKNIHLGHFEKFTRHIDSLRSLQVNPCLFKSESAPLLNTSLPSNVELGRKWDKTLKNTQIDLEVDIECLQNLQIFLKRFCSLSMGQTKSGYLDTRDSCLSRTSESRTEKDVDQTNQRDEKTTPASIKNKDISKHLSNSIEQLRTGDEPSHDRLASTASTISVKLDWIENILKTVIKEFPQLNDIDSFDETSRKTAAKSILVKLYDGLHSLEESAEELFYWNSALKSLEIFGDNIHHSASKQDISDGESLLSEETIALSRSESLSPVSFDGHFPSNSSHQKLKEKDLVNSYLKQSEENKRVPLRPSHKLLSSSQDSVFQRSHYSSPDLGIESDPNHEHSAPEQDNFHSTKIGMSKHDLSGSTMYRNLDKQRLSSIYNFSGSSLRLKDKSFQFPVNDTLRAIGILQDYELLKKEVAESIVGIKSVLSRTGEGLQQMTTSYTSPRTSPRKKLEFSTLKAIKDTCMNIDVCLQKAHKLVNNFWAAPCPSEEELKTLLQQNEELNSKLKRLYDLKKKQEQDFKDVLDRMKQAEIIKEKQEQKISRKLVKTKKVLRLAEKKILETKNKEIPLLAKRSSATSVS